MEHKNNISPIPQYSLGKILLIWAAAAIPMWLLGSVAYPAMSAGLRPVDAALLRIKLLTVGLIWEFVLAMIILYREWGILNSIVTGLIFAFSGKRFHSNWFPIILHSGQSVFLLFLILGLVLGLA